MLAPSLTVGRLPRRLTRSWNNLFEVPKTKKAARGRLSRLAAALTSPFFQDNQLKIE